VEKQTIFYGAGAYASRNIDRWIKEGFKPLCFADKDNMKHGKYWSEINVVSLEHAISRYPNYALYLTLDPKHLYEVTITLRNSGIPQERIKYMDGLEWGLDCVSLDMIFLYGSYIAFCCGNHVIKIYDYFRYPTKDFKSGIKEMYKFRKQLRHCIDSGLKDLAKNAILRKRG